MEHERLKKQGVVVPWVFYRMVAEGRRGKKKPQPITSFIKAFKTACRKAGCPGRLPHDMRRSAVRNLVRAGVPQSVAMKLTGHKTFMAFVLFDNPASCRQIISSTLARTLARLRRGRRAIRPSTNCPVTMCGAR